MPEQKLTIADRVEILDLFATYAWALDTGDAAGVHACFTSDGIFQDATGRYTDLRKFTDYFFTKREGFRGRQHVVTNHLIRGTTEKATVKSFATVVKWETTQTNLKWIHMMGWYDDKLLKVNGAWLFQERLFRRWNDKQLPWVGPLPEGVTIDNDITKRTN